MSNEEIIERLRNDDDYYGTFGKQYLSNSDIYSLLNNPKAFKSESEMNLAYLIGGYFHTAILEPEKLDKYKVVQMASRNSKAYRELGEHCLLQKEVDNILKMQDAINSCNEIRTLIYPLFDDNAIQYEEPGLVDLFGHTWKGKADIINHEEKLIIDLKTTGDIQKFRKSSSLYNYDSQAYIYSQMFGYDFVFIVIDKNTHQLGICETSSDFLFRGELKVQEAVEVFEKISSEGYEPEQEFIYLTL